MLRVDPVPHAVSSLALPLISALCAEWWDTRPLALQPGCGAASLEANLRRGSAALQLSPVAATCNSICSTPSGVLAFSCLLQYWGNKADIVGFESHDTSRCGRACIYACTEAIPLARTQRHCYLVRASCAACHRWAWLLPNPYALLRKPPDAGVLPPATPRPPVHASKSCVSSRALPHTAAGLRPPLAPSTSASEAPRCAVRPPAVLAAAMRPESVPGATPSPMCQEVSLLAFLTLADLLPPSSPLAHRRVLHTCRTWNTPASSTKPLTGSFYTGASPECGIPALSLLLRHTPPPCARRRALYLRALCPAPSLPVRAGTKS
jgi:hypothetical protein